MVKGDVRYKIQNDPICQKILTGIGRKLRDCNTHSQFVRKNRFKFKELKEFGGFRTNDPNTKILTRIKWFIDAGLLKRFKKKGKASYYIYLEDYIKVAWQNLDQLEISQYSWSDISNITPGNILYGLNLDDIKTLVPFCKDCSLQAPPGELVYYNSEMVCPKCGKRGIHTEWQKLLEINRKYIELGYQLVELKFNIYGKKLIEFMKEMDRLGFQPMTKRFCWFIVTFFMKPLTLSELHQEAPIKRNIASILHSDYINEFHKIDKEMTEIIMNLLNDLQSFPEKWTSAFILSLRDEYFPTWQLNDNKFLTKHEEDLKALNEYISKTLFKDFSIDDPTTISTFQSKFIAILEWIPKLSQNIKIVTDSNENFKKYLVDRDMTFDEFLDKSIEKPKVPSINEILTNR